MAAKTKDELIARIKNEPYFLTDDDADQIIGDRKLEQIMMDTIRNNKHILYELPEELRIHFGLKKEFVRTLLAGIKHDDIDEYYEMLYSSERQFELEDYQEHITDYKLLDVVNLLAKEELSTIEHQMLDGTPLQFSFDYEPLVKFVVDNNLQIYAKNIIGSNEVLPNAEPFILNILDTNPGVLPKLEYTSPSIKNKVLDNKLYHLFMYVLDIVNEDDLVIIADAIENDHLTLDDLSVFIPDIILHRPILLPARIKSNMHLTSEDIAVIQSRPDIMKKVERILTERVSSGEYNIGLYSRLLDNSPDLALTILENVTQDESSVDYYSIFVDIGDEKKTRALYDHDKERFKSAIVKYINKGEINRRNVIKHVLTNKSFYQRYLDVLEVILVNLPTEDFTHIFLEINQNTIIPSYMNDVYNDIFKKYNYIGFSSDEPMPRKFDLDSTNIWKPYVILNVIKSFPLMTVLVTISLEKITQISDEQIRNNILTILFQRCAKEKNNIYQNELRLLGNIILPQEVIDIINSPDNPLDLSFQEKVIALGNMNSNSLNCIEHFMSVQTISTSDVSEFFIKISNNIGNNQIEELINTFKFLLISGKIVIDNDEHLNNMFKSILLLLKSNLIDTKYYKELKDMINSYALNVRNLYPETINLFDKDIREDLFNNIDDIYYTEKADALKANNLNPITKVLFAESIIKRYKEHKPISLYLLVNYTDIPIKELTQDNIYVSFNARLIDLLSNTKDYSSEFIDNIIIPNINQDYLRNVNVDFSIFYPEHIDKLIDKLLSIYDKNPNIMFSETIFSLLPSINGKGGKNSTKLLQLFANIKNNINIISNTSILISDDPVIVDYIVTVYIPNSEFYILAARTDELLQKDKYIDAIIKKIEKSKNIDSSILSSNLINNEKIYNTLLNAIRNKNITFFEIKTPSLIKYDIIKTACETDVNNTLYFVKYIAKTKAAGFPKEILEEIIKYIPEAYHLAEEKIKAILKVITPDRLIEVIDDEKFYELMFLHSIDEIKKFSQIFKYRPLDMQQINDTHNSLMSKVFDKENPEVLDLFSIIRNKVQRGLSDEDREIIIDMLSQYKPANIETILSKHQDKVLLGTYARSYSKFIDYLLDRLYEAPDLYADVLSTLTSNYIVQKRGEYLANEGKIDNYTGNLYVIDDNSLYDNFFKYLLENEFDTLLNVLKHSSFKENGSYVQNEVLSSTQLERIKNTLEYLRNPEQFKDYDKGALSDLKRNIHFEKVKFYEIVKNYSEPGRLPKDYLFLLDTPEFMKGVKKRVNIPKETLDIKNIIKILSTDTFFKNIINDEEKFKCLLEVLDKYSCLSWGELFNNQLAKLSNTPYEKNNIVIFVNAFNQIYEKEKVLFEEYKQKRIQEAKDRDASAEEIEKIKNLPLSSFITPYKIYKYTTVYSSIANCYRIILGQEDCEIIKENKPPHPGVGDPITRLQKCCRLQVEAMLQSRVTIPSFIEDYDDGKNKPLRVIVGNKMAPYNLTHGERTEACMRAYGMADDLFSFCLTDPRAFHITFVDPNTGKYVSRVSGFRNGNTVFLNQVRFSANPDFSTDDVRAACEAVANDLIERSKDSEMPIENVVCSASYAYQEATTKPLSSTDIRGGIYDGHLDVTHNPHILATTSKDGYPEDLKPNADNQPKYRIVRTLPIHFKEHQINIDALVLMQRVTALKECLLHLENPDYYKTIDFNPIFLEKQFEYLILGQDWFVALEKDGTILKDEIGYDNRAESEIREALAYIEQLKKEKVGVKNGPRK